MAETNRGVHEKGYTMSFHRANPDHIVAVRRSLSKIRLAPYDELTRDEGRSLRLYEWNIEVSAACYATLHVVEVCLRNAIHDQLTRWHQDQGYQRCWLDDPGGLLDQRRRSDVTTAKSRLKHKGKTITPDAIVAELSFGFWRYLLSARYEWTLWMPAVRHGFPHVNRRRELAAPVERLHNLRNRLAHHEPIHGRNLVGDHFDMMSVLGAICPHTFGWARDSTRLPLVLLHKPARIIPFQRRPGRILDADSLST